jgi:hypothetical protein
MDVTSLAALGLGMQTAGAQQDLSVANIKMALENNTGAAMVLVNQVAEQAKVSAAAAAAGGINILV